MQQIMEQITALRTPLKLNGLINGSTISIKRDHPEDTLHFGKEISLKIYDRQEIAAGQSRYQIARQPQFSTHGILNNRRGDMMLLINGMPLFHIELKKSGIPISQAANQIEKYAREGVFTGLFALVQIFVAMEPNETLYFANPGPDGTFNSDYYFHWADFDNEPIQAWKDIASTLLSIPMAHQLIGFYTVPDQTDGILKVMRSYQYYAANAISDKVSKTKWTGKNLLGGYIWHTTGSGKTMTSFKSAQLIAASKDADKVIFLMDRIELGTQSLAEYRNFAQATESIQATENTEILISKLISDNPADTLIVTSIQKMSNIKEEDGMKTADLDKISGKRIVIIVDEAHRSTFGEMLIDIKKTFSGAIFFGFTGTPIHPENQKKGNTTATVFGNELHRYSIADGIRDENVLGFDPYMVTTYRDKDVRKAVAIDKAKATSEADAITDPHKNQIYYKYMDASKVSMVGHYDQKGNYIKGIEDYLPTTQYTQGDHPDMVVQDICQNWVTLSRGSKFHALLATSSIPEAITYYRLIKEKMPLLKISALFDPNIDNGEGTTTAFKEKGLEEIILDYNAQYGQKFELATHQRFKKDIASRLAHKEQYKYIERTPELQLDLLIVVDQMLTGFDSKWVNTLYLDKVLEYQNIIQAFSRTNRLFGHDKPFGIIRYYRKPHTMKRNIAEAVKLYSGDKPIGLFVQKLPQNCRAMNAVYEEIHQVFTNAGVNDFTKNPEDTASCGKFASCFKELNQYLEAARIQGFSWGQLDYELPANPGEESVKVTLTFDENTYLSLALRYKELFTPVDATTPNAEDIPYEIDGYLTEIDTGKIDADYMNANFEKYLKLLHLEPKPSDELIRQALDTLHKTFAILNQDEQKYANLFLHDVESGDAVLTDGKTLRDYIAEYEVKATNDQLQQMVDTFGLAPSLLRSLMQLRLTEHNLNAYGRFDKLVASVDMIRARQYFTEQQGKEVSPARVSILLDKLLREYLLDAHP
jgi:type I restriction enzyme R subunit